MLSHALSSCSYCERIKNVLTHLILHNPEHLMASLVLYIEADHISAVGNNLHYNNTTICFDSHLVILAL